MFSWRVGVILVLINAVVTAVVFSHLGGAGPGDGLPKALVAILVTGLICAGVDWVKRYVQKSRAMREEIERLGNSRRPEA
jgi:hypothetical protein